MGVRPAPIAALVWRARIEISVEHCSRQLVRPHIRFPRVVGCHRDFEAIAFVRGRSLPERLLRLSRPPADSGATQCRSQLRRSAGSSGQLLLAVAMIGRRPIAYALALRLIRSHRFHSTPVRQRRGSRGTQRFRGVSETCAAIRVRERHPFTAAKHPRRFECTGRPSDSKARSSQTRARVPPRPFRVPPTPPRYPPPPPPPPPTPPAPTPPHPPPPPPPPRVPAISLWQIGSGRYSRCPEGPLSSCAVA